MIIYVSVIDIKSVSSWRLIAKIVDYLQYCVLLSGVNTPYADLKWFQKHTHVFLTLTTLEKNYCCVQ